MSSTHSLRRSFALADVNSMYASCEEVFRPDIRGKPVVVLSNNDGCVIAQNKLAKETLDIYMARPWFEIEEQARKLGTIVFSSNYELYANMSNRFATVLSRFSPRMEKYSIDETFLEMTGINKNYSQYGQEIKDTVMQSTGLPICVGFGFSKTLAKLANHCAKKQDKWNGVCDLTTISEQELDGIMQQLPVSKVWGVGRKLEARLNQLGVHDVLRLKRANCKRIRDEFGVVLERTVKELNGEVWLEMEDVLPEAKQVMSSRSFGTRASTLQDLEEAIAYHAAMAGERMREKGLFANGVYVFIMNSPHDKAEYYSNSHSIGLPSPTNSTIKITKAAQWILKRIYKPGVYYQKAGVMLLDTIPAGGLQTDLFGYSKPDTKAEALMSAIDRINKKYARGAIKLASEGVEKPWRMRRSFKSPNYTGDWDELPRVL
ncbi:MAG: translesion error-prone DNA polymerase V subunit UmuC [Methylophilaceae bacterium]